MAATKHVLYDNAVLIDQVTDLLNTKLNTRALMKHDTSLTTEAGTKVEINVYTYEGQSEALAIGEENSVKGKVTYEPKEYRVALEQQTFEYADEDVMKDPKVVEVGINGATTVMVNEMNDKYFDELAKATLTHQYTSGGFNYDTIVDAVAKLNVEDETGLYILIGNDLKAQVRKDPDFKSAKLGEILFNGQIGDICGIPVLVSKKVPANQAYIADINAVTCFTKKDADVEQERAATKRLNSIIMRRVNLVALTDATKVVKLAPASAKAAKESK